MSRQEFVELTRDFIFHLLDPRTGATKMRLVSPNNRKTFRCQMRKIVVGESVVHAEDQVIHQLAVLLVAHVKVGGIRGEVHESWR